MVCNHTIVLEIYSDKIHTQISYYYCVNCGERKGERFGFEIISELRKNILNNLN